MSTTPNFGIVMPEGTDTFAPLTFDNNAYTLIDSVMKANQDRSITPASCVISGGIVTLTRSITSCAFFVFTATGDFDPLETVSVDGVTVSVRYADGTVPEAGAWVINQSVLCYLNGTILNVISTRAKGVSAGTIGALGDLETVDKSSIVAAINENTEEIEKLYYEVGDVITLPNYYGMAAWFGKNSEIAVLTLPLSKPLKNVNGCSISGSIIFQYEGNGTILAPSMVTNVAVTANALIITFDVSSLTTLIASPANRGASAHTSGSVTVTLT